MRRALLAAGQLVRRTRGHGACADPLGAISPALPAAAAGWTGGDGGSGRSSGLSLPWALHPLAPLHQSAAAALQRAPHSSSASGNASGMNAGDESGSSSGSHSGSSSSKFGGSTPDARYRGGSQPSPVPDVDSEQLLRSLGLSGTAVPAALLRNLRKLSGVRQQGVLDNATAVAAHLCSPAVGLTAQQAGQVLERCPVLFSWPPEQRAAVLFGELLGAGLTAGAAAKCFATYPPAAQSSTFAPGLAELAAILAHSQDRQAGRRAMVPAAQRTVAVLLSRISAAVHLVSYAATSLQQRASELQQAGCTASQVAAMAWRHPELLSADASAKLASRVALLQQELGLPAAQVFSLAARHQPRWLSSSVSTLQERAEALAKGFSQATAAAMLLKNHSTLNCDPTVWRRNLCYMAACGVADPHAVLGPAPILLHFDHAAADFLQRRLMLQYFFQMTAAQLYEQHPRCFVRICVERLAQRLQFVEQRGQAHRLVAKAANGGGWAATGGEEQQPALSLRTVAGEPERFLAAMGASQAEWEAWAASNPPAACQLFGWAQQAAAEEAARLAVALPPELAQWEKQPHSLRRKGAAIRN